MKKNFALTLATIIFVANVLFPITTNASGITIRPFLIDVSLTAREDSQNLVTLRSSYEHRKAVVYATVNEITVDSEGEIKQFTTPVMTDRTNTVTSWIEITRGRIEIPAGETREVPLTVRLHPHAEPGEYHVFIGFVEAPNKPKAQQVAMAGEADGVILKVTVEDERKDSMRISSFKIDRFVTGGGDRDITIDLENSGDLATVPKGEIIFYDSKGIEISSIPVEGDTIEPGQAASIISQIPLNDSLGKFKANLSLQYGVNQTASLFDTTFFYLMPVQLLIMLFVGVLAVSLFVVFLLRGTFVSDEDKDDFDEVAMYVKEGHEPEPKDHDINLKNDT